MDTAQWPQGIGLVKPMAALNSNNNNNNNNNIMNNNNNNNNTMIRTATATAAGGEGSQVMVERKTRPQKEQALNCPRCNSTNTKFCYYNNYSLTQPRYFCKTCRRYWTEGGSLRNVPVGGGSRKNKRSTSSCTTTSTTTATTSSSPSTLPSIRGQDLNLSFPNPRNNMGEFGEMASIDHSSGNNNNGSTNQTSCSASSSSSLTAMELLRSGMAVRGLSPFVSMPDHAAGLVPYPAGFGLHHDHFKPPPSLSFNIPHDQVQENAGRLLFPFEDLRQVDESNRGGHGGDAQGFWSGMMGGGHGGGAGGAGSW